MSVWAWARGPAPPSRAAQVTSPIIGICLSSFYFDPFYPCFRASWGVISPMRRRPGFRPAPSGGARCAPSTRRPRLPGRTAGRAAPSPTTAPAVQETSHAQPPAPMGLPPRDRPAAVPAPTGLRLPAYAGTPGGPPRARRRVRRPGHLHRRNRPLRRRGRRFQRRRQARLRHGQLQRRRRWHGLGAAEHDARGGVHPHLRRPGHLRRRDRPRRRGGGRLQRRRKARPCRHQLRRRRRHHDLGATEHDGGRGGRPHLRPPGHLHRRNRRFRHCGGRLQRRR